MKKILLYSDAKQTGGHEVLGVEIARLLSVDYKVYFILSSYNQDLIHRLEELKNIKLFLIPYFSNHLQIVRNFWSYKTSAIIKKIIEKVSPQLCIALQGTIDSSFLIIPICKKEGIRVISYIPIVFDLKKISKHKFIGRLKDYVQKYYYKQPDFFITINELLAERLRKKSGHNNIFIIKNGIDFRRYKHYKKEECRKKYNIDETQFVIGYIGRLELWHKGLDYYIDYLKKYASCTEDITYLFVGGGGAEEKINKLTKEHKNIILLPWTEDVSEVYILLDCYTLFSRFESGPGCPITLIEALYFEIPVIASDIPEIAKILPPENLFTLGNNSQFINKIRSVQNGKIKKVDFNNSNYSLDEFKNNWIQCIGKLLN